MLHTGFARGCLLALLVLIAGEASAGLTATMGFFNYTTSPHDMGTVPVGGTATFSDLLHSILGTNRITALSISGEFALNTTCVIGNAYAPASNCGVNTVFQPTSPGTKTGVLTVSCTPAPVIGGVTFLCDGLPHTFAFTGLAVALGTTAIPTLDRWAITALGLLLMGWGALHLWQRQRAQHR